MTEKKLYTHLGGGIAAALMLCGCAAAPQTPEALLRWAGETYGDCTLVSQSTHEQKVSVVVHDTLQDFDYAVSSQTQELTVDNTSFGTLPASRGDDFRRRLVETVTDALREELDALSRSAGVSYREESASFQSGHSGDPRPLLVMFAPTEAAGRAAALESARLFQQHNLNGRLDTLCIEVYSQEEDPALLGRAVLPEVSWQTAQEVRQAYFTKLARAYTDPQAEFLYYEEKPFSRSGADLERVYHTYHIPDRETPVGFYYFRAEDGSVYFICDFPYQIEDVRECPYYTTGRRAEDPPSLWQQLVSLALG